MSAGPALTERPSPSSTATAPAIVLAGLRRDYDERPVLRDLDLSLEAGATLAVLGPNGAGKSTLLRILATLLRPSAGTVAVFGHELPRRRLQVRGRIGYLGHEPMLYRELTVAENLRLQATLHGVEDAEARIAELLAAAGLERRAGQRVRDLSAGMVQRAAACRAVLHDPELLLLDEPTSHLDLDATERVGALLAAAPQRTRVIVSHDPEAALADCDRALVLRGDGSVAYEGPAADLSPGDARAAYGSSR